MPIPNKIKMNECVGRYATVDRDIFNGAGHGVAKGSKVLIIGYGRSLSIKTDPCPHCGQMTKIRNVNKNNLTLIE